MEPVASHETVAVLYELDIGQHTLFLMSDGSLDLLTHDTHIPAPVGHGVHLDRDEAYRLCMSLYAQFSVPSMEENGEISDQGLPGQQQQKGSFLSRSQERAVKLSQTHVKVCLASDSILA